MNYRSTLFITGVFLEVIAITMLIPAFIDGLDSNPDWKIFITSAFITSCVGGFMILTNSEKDFTLHIRDAFFLTAFSWICLPFFAALPFWLGNNDMSFTDSFFEAMSGLTTTGSTVISNLEQRPPGLLIWRSILQWLGGIGIIVMALSILPMLKVGGMQLFKMESSENEKILPRVAQLASSIGIIYVALTLICAILYYFYGMSFFDAINHAMTTLSTGGFSTHDASIGFFHQDSIKIIGILFCTLGSLPFVLYLKAVRGDWQSLFKDTQVQTFLGAVLIFIAIMTTHTLLNGYYDDINKAIIQTSFNIMSVISGTGYASTDYSQWGTFAIGFMFFITFIGGCAGSTSCGIKVFRFQIIYSITITQMKKLLYPHGIFQAKYNGREISRDIPVSVLSFVFVYGICFIFAALFLQFLGLDYMTAMSGAATAISNVGPGLGDIIGPAGNFAPLPDSAKWVLSICMMLGRLEVFTVLVIFTPQFWKE